jgi:hypothetical protein
MWNVTESNSPDLDDADPGDASQHADQPIPDESTLLGKVGVQEEVLAELARAEAEMSDSSDDSDATGAQV